MLEQNVKASVFETHIRTHITIEGQSHVAFFPNIKGNINYEFVPLNSQPNFPTYEVLKIYAGIYIYRMGHEKVVRLLFCTCPSDFSLALVLYS